ncbi:hypothetical protein CPB83DRAFT_849743 [Crepidotus variabilis]|uniref:Uncharacterized protein n=1 Tax=Crepidotus variabilis TaxID=179855 RepID=A0A9P6JS20_9AGAR|nr:hypothetical protein CPB83DRAFT_849743 [Crepidotus variabilis]
MISLVRSYALSQLAGMTRVSARSSGILHTKMIVKTSKHVFTSPRSAEMSPFSLRLMIMPIPIPKTLHRRPRPAPWQESETTQSSG